MKLKLITFLLITLAFTSIANAKIQWGTKIMGDLHANTIKGFLYDISHNVNTPAHVVLWRPNFTKAIVWLNRVHAKKKVYQLEKSKDKEEAAIIAGTIEAIADVVRGNHQHFTTNEEINAALHRWTSMGKQVVVSYSEKTTKDANNNKINVKINWVFKLKSKKTKNLIERW